MVSDNYYKQIVHDSPVGYARHSFIYDAGGNPVDFTFAEVNKAFERLTGLSKDDVTGESLLSLLPDHDKESASLVSDYADAYGRKGGQEFVRFIPALKRWYKIGFQSLGDGGFCTFFTDITQEKEQSAALEDFFSVNLDLLCIANTDGYFVKVNREWEQALGYTIEELHGSRFLDFVHDDDMEATMGAISELASQEKVINFTNRFRTRDGDYRIIEWRSHPRGKLIYAAARDITDRVKTSLVLEENEELFRKMSDATSTAIFIYQGERFVRVNKAAVAITGYSAEELCGGMKFWELIHPDHREMVKSRGLRRQLGEDVPPRYEFKISCKDGTVKWLEFSAGKISWTGRPAAIGTAYDITDRKQDYLLQQTLFSIASATMTTRDIEELVRLIRRHLAELIDTRNFFIALYDEETDMFSVPYNEDEQDEITTWPAGGSVTGLVVSERKSLLLREPELHAMINNGSIQQVGQMCAVWLGVPLFSGEDVIGAIVVQDYDNPNAFTEHNKEVLEFVTNHIGLAIQRQKTLEELIESKERAEQSDKLKTAFLNNLSHEIRTPLNAIRGFTEYLGEELQHNAEIRHITDIIVRSGDQLLSIINDIINISTIEAGLLEAHISPVTITRVAETVYHQLLPAATEKSLSLQLDNRLTDKNLTVDTDETKLLQILSNLIQNAIKFTSSGKVVLRVQEEGLCVQFSVIDTGGGVSQEEQAIIFERFRQGEGSQRDKSGMGLGLSIAKSFVELLGGEIWVASQMKKGSTFCFTIPRAITVPGKVEPSQEEGHIGGEAPLHIVVAEDEIYGFELIKTILSDHSVKLYHAGNGKEAIDLCENEPEVNLVLMDIKMPVMGGMEACRKIKSIRPELPVLALTAYALPGDREKLLGHGFDDYVSKPITRESFLKKIRSFV